MTAPSPTLCPDCGGVIPADAPRGLCVICLTGLLFPDESAEGGSFEDRSYMAYRTYTTDADPADSAPPPPGDAAADPENAAAFPPRTFGGWRVLRPAGEGAFGLVFEACQDLPVPRRAALKVLKPGLDSREIMTRFAAERELLAELDHPGIARILDAGTENGRPWLASEWVTDARTIVRHGVERGLSLREKIGLFRLVCGAVAHAHQRGIIHRDLKPSNLLVGPDGQPKVIDFGIARATERVLAGGTLVTLAGQVLGTPAYMSPEQAAGGGADADVRSDLYSLGAVLFECLAGRPPLSLESGQNRPLQEVLRLVREAEPDKPSQLNPALAGELEWILLKAIEKEPARRYETAAALSRDLESWLSGGTVQAAPPGRRYRMGKFLRRHRAAAAGFAGVLLALILGLIGTSAMYFRAKEGERLARENQAAAERQGAAARRFASQGAYHMAQLFFDRNQPAQGLTQLIQAVGNDPTNHTVAERLLAELVWSDLPQLAAPPVTMPEPVRKLTFSPDGSRLAVICHQDGIGPGMVALFTAGGGGDGRIGEAQLPADGVYRAAFSPDNQTLALAMAEGGVIFRRATDGSPDPSRPALPHTRPVMGLTWIAPDRIATVEHDPQHPRQPGTGRLWDLTTGQVLDDISPIPGLAQPAVSPDASRMAWVTWDGTVPIVDVRSGQPVSNVKTPGYGTAAFAGPGGRLLAVQTEGGKLHVYRILREDGEIITPVEITDPMQSSREPLRPVPVPMPGPFPASIPSSASGPIPASASGPAPGPAPAQAAASGEECHILTTGIDGLATLWNAGTGQPERHFEGKFLTGQFSADGSRLALGGPFQEYVVLWDTRRQKAAFPPVHIPGGATVMSLSANGRWLACGSTENRLTIHDLTSRAARPMPLPAPGPAPVTAAWNPDGNAFTLTAADGKSTTWTASGHLQPTGAQLPPVSAAARRSGAHRTQNQTDPADQPDQPDLSDLSDLSDVTLLSPDGKTRATAGTTDNRVTFRQVSGGAVTGFLQHPGKVHALAFDQTGTRLATLCGEGSGTTLRLWEPAAGILLMPPCSLPDGIRFTTLALNPQGTRAVLTSETGAILLHGFPPRLITAPSWLIPFATRRAGLPPAQYGTPSAPKISLAPGASDPYSPEAGFRNWLNTPVLERPVSPGLEQTRADYHDLLAHPPFRAR